MRIKKGIAVSPGIAVAQAFLLDSEEFAISRQKVPSAGVPAQVDRFVRAKERAGEEIEALLDEVMREVGSEGAAILQMHIALLKDPDFHTDVVRWIHEGPHTAEYAVSRATRTVLKRFQSSKSIIAQRGADIRDMENRLLRNLLGAKRRELAQLDGEVVIIARDLTPTLTASLDKSKVRGIATDLGGKTSHTAIMARALRIPAVVGLQDVSVDVSSGDMVVIDGTRGKIIIDPTASTQKGYRAREKDYLEFEREIEFEQKDLPAETIDGHTIHLEANIELVEEVETAAMYGAEGVGLYRTEFLFRGDGSAPGEREQIEAYRKAVQALGGKAVTIRTLDLGADKISPDGMTANERNPFLGCRSIRYCFERMDLFKTQLRAILQAAVHGPIRIMFPMISALEEIRQAKLILEDVMEDLQRERVPFQQEIPIGIMIEVPSAALIPDILAQEVDFFSIGTNDLIQYTLAVDRTNERVATLYQPAHPANFRLLQRVIIAGERQGIEVSMCGEMASEIVYVIPLLGLGLRDLSLVPNMIPDIKKVIRSVTLRQCEEVTARVLESHDAAQTEIYLKDVARPYLPDLISGDSKF